VVKHLKQLQLQDLKLSLPAHPQGIGIRNILELGGSRITLYFLPAGQTMKLHNHPSMLVISHLLRGDISALLYSPTPQPAVFRREALRLRAPDCAFIDGIRHPLRNLHQLTANEDTYFVDILFPDYDENRQCLFLEEEQQLTEHEWKLRPCEEEDCEFFEL
jgi:hypothetical protein